MLASPSRYRFGIFEVDPIAGELFRQGRKVRLQEQPFQVLLALVAKPQEVVTREELRQRLWPDTTVDFDRGLNKAVNRLRSALGDDAENPRFIETVPLRGYRFLAPVTSTAADPAPASLAESGRANSSVHPEAVPGESAVAADEAEARFARRPILALIASTVIAPGAYFLYRSIRQDEPAIRSIAVLPLENLSADPEQEYFSDGMTDELIAQLSGIESLRVISRTSVMRYRKPARKLLPEIARELNVDAIIEGTISHSGEKVRINVQLIRAVDDKHLWSGRFERDLGRILSVQNEVARAVAQEVRLALAPRRTGLSLTDSPVVAEAYDAYLRANYMLVKGILGTGKSIELYRTAIRLDPTFPDAWAGLAEALVYAAIFGLAPSKIAYPQAQAASKTALDLNPRSARAHNALADVKKGYHWQLSEAEKEYIIATDLDPNHLLTRLWYSECLARMRRADAALRESDRALELAPVSPISTNHRSMILFRLRRFEDAIRTGEQGLELDPRMINAFWWIGMSHSALGKYPNAIQALAQASQMGGGPIFTALLGHVYGLSGNRAKALEMLGELTSIANSNRFVSPMDFAILHAGLRDAGQTFRWLDKAYEERAARMHELSSSYFDSISQDSRYHALIERVGLPPALP